MRGYFEIGIYHGKTEANIGTLWRSAYQLGAAGIFIIGKRFKRQPSDTLNTALHVPLREYPDFDNYLANLPHGCMTVAIEMGGRPMAGYTHPIRASYLLGAEDRGIPADILRRCHSRINIEYLRAESYNVAVAGSLVMYHRQIISGLPCSTHS